MASRPHGALYTGVTNDLIGRVHTHREGIVPGFSKKYRTKLLVYFERHATMPLAIQREKNIKHWSRGWKTDLIEGMNPTWRDLWTDLVG